MSDTTASARTVIHLSMVGAFATMAFQVAGKAARDALFLSAYRPSQLPRLVVAAALTAILLSFLQGRILTRISPARYIPLLILFSAGLQAAEWVTWESHPGPSAIMVYIHMVALGALITSGFWSVINEQFDPWTAKQAFGKIAGAGTAGGVAGGFLAERTGAMFAPQSVLLVTTGMQVLTAVCLYLLPRNRLSDSGRGSPVRLLAWDLLRDYGWFRQLSLLVLAGTFSAALLDYVLKADARHTLGPGEPLLRFFALFHTGTAFISFVLQLGATSKLLNRFGLGATVSTLPTSVSLSGAAAALAGGLPAITAARAVEAVVRGSFFRAGYELLYTPMLPSEKRVIKSFNDVTVDRLGDALGGGFAQAAILLGPGLSARVMLGTAALVSAGGWLLSRTLNRGYVASLERSLEHYSDEEAAPAVATAAGAGSSREAIRLGESDDTADLLGQPGAIDRCMIPYVVPLLGEPVLRRQAAKALEAIAANNVGQLSDYLMDASEPVDVRRRIADVIASAANERAVAALMDALREPDLAVRVSVGRALNRMHERGSVTVPEEPVLNAIRQELRRGGANHRIVLEHIFALLSLVLSAEHVRIAYEALMTGQDHLRGIAREYLESSLPADIAESLLSALQPEPIRLD